MENFIFVQWESSDNYSKTSRGLWQYYRDEWSDQKVNSNSFISKTPAVGNTKNVQIAVSLKYLRVFLENSWNTSN